MPKLTNEVLDALLRDPEKFEVQYLSISGPRAALYGRLIDVLSVGAKTPLSGLVPIVRQLVRTARELPEFARMTKTLSPTAMAVRDTLLRAKEPAPLLFHDLPIACSKAAFEATGTPSAELVESFVEELRAAVRELRLAYPKLLDLIEDAIRTGLSLPASTADLQKSLALRAARLAPLAVEPQLNAFLALAAGEQPRDEWLASFGTFLSGKPPNVWRDNDVDLAGFTIGVLCRRFLSLESVLDGPEAATVADVRSLVRVAVSPPRKQPRSLTVALRPEHEPAFGSVRAQMQDLAARLSTAVSGESLLAALGVVTHELMSETESSTYRTDPQAAT